MSAVIAKEPMGVCCGCGLPVEADEYILLRPGGAIHVGCPERATAAGPTIQTESSGFLFDDPVRAEHERAKEKIGATRIVVHGDTYSERRDKERLTKHLLAVFALMKDGQYRDTELIATCIHAGPTTVQARLRQLRAIGHSVPKRWVKGINGANGHFEYALIVNRSLMSNEWEGQCGSRAA
jgi:hypothetical protein